MDIIKRFREPDFKVLKHIEKNKDKYGIDHLIIRKKFQDTFTAFKTDIEGFKKYIPSYNNVFREENKIVFVFFDYVDYKNKKTSELKISKIMDNFMYSIRDIEKLISFGESIKNYKTLGNKLAFDVKITDHLLPIPEFKYSTISKLNESFESIFDNPVEDYGTSYELEDIGDNSKGDEYLASSFTQRDMACILLKVPETNKEWLNELINKSKLTNASRTK